MLELESQLHLAEIIARGALARQESRGSHFRTDYPDARRRPLVEAYLGRAGRRAHRVVVERGGHQPAPAEGAHLLRPIALRYFRYLQGSLVEPRFQEFSLDVEGSMSVLEALLTLQDEQDPTLAFRYCCRGAICGSCSMSINGKLDLACRVQLSSFPTEHIVLEPMPGFDVLKDLVVDMDAFWAKYRRVEPWLHGAAEVPADFAPSSARRSAGQPKNSP